MIITFHLAVYFAYYVLEKCISTIFGEEDNRPNIQDNSNVDGNNPVNPVSPTENIQQSTASGNEPNLSRSRNEPTTTNRPTDQKEQVKEGEGDLCSSTECVIKETNPDICNAEPTFFCQFDSEEGGMKFIPPVFTQRYMVIENILKEPCWRECIKKVVDFGCAELIFEVRHLRKLFDIEEIVAIDIDEYLLSHHSCRVRPSPTDYLQPRPSPLTVSVACGSVAHTNPILCNTDAVIAIELIEHLLPNDLECLPFTIFGFMKPKIAMFTTPNADFNVLFHNFSGSRHWDHKFEWSRQQFEDWATNLVQRYPDYTVTFQGIGPGPAGTEHLGCCSQMATFVKVYNSYPLTEDELHVQDGEYILIQECAFPYFVDRRTPEEQIRDEAVNFINRCISLSRYMDDDVIKEIPLKNIMERAKCFNRSRLKEILTKDNWEVKTNADGYEVVVLPDSDYEDEESEDQQMENEESHPVECIDDNNTMNIPREENWDCDESVDCTVTDPNVQLDCSASGGGDEAQYCHCVCLSVDTPPTSRTDVVPSDVLLNNGVEEKCSVSDTTDSDVFTTLSSAQTIYVPKKPIDLNCSSYETPHNSSCTRKTSHVKLSGTNEESKTLEGCNTELSCRTVENLNCCDLENKLPVGLVSPKESRSDLLCSVNRLSSPFDTSLYATPCCSELHKSHIPKCLSLQQINTRCESPFSSELMTSSCKGVLMEEKMDKFSKSMEGLKCQESCDIHETCSNASKVVDSGYPDSYSDYNMDTDLTPEQFDDIETESDGNVSSRSLSPVPPPAPQVHRIVDNVENGDVANNNRDGEGNNVVADMEEEPLEFQAQIDEVDDEFPNLAAVGHDMQEMPSVPPSPELAEDPAKPWSKSVFGDNDLSAIAPKENLLSFEVVNNSEFKDCDLTVSDVEEEFSDFEPQIDISNVGPNFDEEEDPMFQQYRSPAVSQHEKSHSAVEIPKIFINHLGRTSSNCSDLKDQDLVTNSESNSSIVTCSSLSYVDSTDSQTTVVDTQGDHKHNNEQVDCSLKSHNSLTTVLDGRSKFSDCSLVCPVDTNDTMCKTADTETPSLDKSVLQSTESTQGRDVAKENETLHLYQSPSQQDHLSVRSEYESAESLNISTHECGESSFPEWMLNIQIPDADERAESVVTLWDFDSHENLVDSNYDVPVDARGGGDPQTEAWQ